MNTKPLVTCEGLTVGYGRRPVLRDLNLHLPGRCFTALAGQNGSGKSTLLKTLVGILPPLGGAMRFHLEGDRRPGLGYVPQQESLDPRFLLSAFEIALMGACARVGPGRFIGRRERELAQACLEQAGAAALARQRFSELSGGQKQRVLIARALVTQPDLLVLDEPTSGLDAAASRHVMELLARLNHDHHLAILMVNHDLAALRGHVDEVIWLHDGQATQGSASDMLTRDRIETMLGLTF